MAWVDHGRDGCLGSAVEDVIAKTACQDVADLVAAHFVVAAAANPVFEHCAIGDGDVVGFDSGRAEAALAQVQHGVAREAREVERVDAAAIPDAEAHRGIEAEIVGVNARRAVETVGCVGGAGGPVDAVFHLHSKDVVQARGGKMGNRATGIGVAPVRHVRVLATVIEVVCICVGGRIAVVVARVVQADAMAQFVHQKSQRVGARIHRGLPGNVSDLNIAAALAGEIRPAAAVGRADTEHVGDVGIVGIGRLDEPDSADVGVELHGGQSACL